MGHPALRRLRLASLLFPTTRSKCARRSNGALEAVASKHARGVTVRGLVGRGDAAAEIVRMATAEQSDLIVLATHGWTGWRHVVFGSVAEKVLREAPCPVLSVRTAAR